MIFKRSSLGSGVQVLLCSSHNVDEMPRHVRYPFPDLGIKPSQISLGLTTVNRGCPQFQPQPLTYAEETPSVLKRKTHTFEHPFPV